MARRVSLPGAEEFFRHTNSDPADIDVEAEVAEPTPPVRLVPGSERAGRHETRPPYARRGSGRERHDEKITVYVSMDELYDLEQARLNLRRHHGLTADRGRMVREAVAAVLEDLEQYGERSVLVRRLSDG